MADVDGDDKDVDATSVWFAKFGDPADCYRAFEAYGHAMAAASTFEMLMALMVLKAFALKLDKRANANIQPADGPALIKALLSNSYDRLQRRLSNCYALSAELKVGLQDGKDVRDHLAHNFWQGHVGNLFSPEGVDVIAEARATSANHFRLLASSIFEETGESADDFIKMILEDPERLDKLKGWRAALDTENPA